MREAPTSPVAAVCSAPVVREDLADCASQPGQRRLLDHLHVPTRLEHLSRHAAVASARLRDPCQQPPTATGKAALVRAPWHPLSSALLANDEVVSRPGVGQRGTRSQRMTGRSPDLPNIGLAPESVDATERCARTCVDCLCVTLSVRLRSAQSPHGYVVLSKTC